MGIAASYRGPGGAILPGPQKEFKEILEGLKGLFQQEGISVAYLFGSYVRNEAKATSDIDIAVLLERVGKELYSFYQKLMLGVREVLGSERFDLLLLNDAPPALKFTIITQGYPICFRDEEALNKFEMDVIRRFQDTACLREVQNSYLRGRAREWYSANRAS